MDINYWINLQEYSAIALLWNGIGCLFWLIAYINLLYKSSRTKYVEMPFFIATGNLAWEFIWGFWFHPTTGELFVLAYQIAFILDLAIFWKVIQYGSKQIDIPLMKDNFLTLLMVLLAIWIPLNYLFVYQGYDTAIGATSGYILNLIISLLYPIHFLRNNPTYFSPAIAWCKFFGTGCITISMFIIYPSNHLIQFIGCTCFIIDLYYINLLRLRIKTLTI